VPVSDPFLKGENGKGWSRKGLAFSFMGQLV
jgi:hypothetical protein